MTVPSTGVEKTLGKIRQELESNSTSAAAPKYNEGPFTTSQTSLKIASTQTTATTTYTNNNGYVSQISGNNPDEVTPYSIDEFSGYQHNTVLCTELYNQGVMSKKLYAADCEITSKLYHGTLLYDGYIIFARYYLWILRNCRKFSKKYGHHIILAWAEYLAYINGTEPDKNTTGRNILYLGKMVLPIIGILSKISNNNVYTNILSIISFIITFPVLFIYSNVILIKNKVYGNNKK